MVVDNKLLSRGCMRKRQRVFVGGAKRRLVFLPFFVWGRICSKCLHELLILFFHSFWYERNAGQEDVLDSSNSTVSRAVS